MERLLMSKLLTFTAGNIQFGRAIGITTIKYSELYVVQK